jgi:hypothetical protein
MAIGKETSNPLFSMIHLSQVLTHLDVMRIVSNLYVLMYIWSCVAAKNGVFQMLNDHRDSTSEDSLLLMFILNSLSCAIGDLSRNLELNHVKFKIREGL